MKTKTQTTQSGVPECFLKKFGKQITAILSGFDRIRFRATQRLLFQPNSMESYLATCGVLIKHFRDFAEDITERVKAAAYKAAARAGRPVQYLGSPNRDKETLARELARQDGIKEGLIAVLTAVEPCLSYSVRGDAKSKQIHLVLETRKCLHLYHDDQHRDFGLMHVRVQSWFPFTVDVCLNGREWLARQMDAAGLHDVQRDNYFTWVEDPLQVQALLAAQLKTNWARTLDALLQQAHPLHREIGRPFHQPYDWSASQTEYATDVLFEDGPSLARWYRPIDADPEQRLRWQRLRRGVADLWRRGEVSQGSNRRYLEALASVTGKTPLRDEAVGALTRPRADPQNLRNAPIPTHRTRPPSGHRLGLRPKRRCGSAHPTRRVKRTSEILSEMQDSYRL